MLWYYLFVSSSCCGHFIRYCYRDGRRLDRHPTWNVSLFVCPWVLYCATSTTRVVIFVVKSSDYWNHQQNTKQQKISINICSKKNFQPRFLWEKNFRLIFWGVKKNSNQNLFGSENTSSPYFFMGQQNFQAKLFLLKYFSRPKIFWIQNTPGTAGGPGGRDRTLAVKSHKISRKSAFFV